MKAINLLIKILLINVFFITLANSAKNEFFKEGKILFDKKELKKI